MATSSFLRSHRCHDYQALMRRWRSVVKGTGLALQPLFETAGFTVHSITPRRPRPGPALYLAAGVHGDEPAGTLGLLDWAERHPQALAELPLRLLPCLNPWGLIHNTRGDHRGLDLNRRFHLRRDPRIRAWQDFARAEPLALALTLHEDYEAQGIYCYELKAGRELVAPPPLQRAAQVIGPDPRGRIDGHRAGNGLIVRSRGIPRNLPGMPEAIELFQHWRCPTLTFETPSEFSLEERVQAQRRFIEGAVAWFRNRTGP